MGQGPFEHRDSGTRESKPLNDAHACSEEMMGSLKLYPVKKVEIIVGGDHLKFVKDLLDDVRVSGYTIIPNVSGKGHSGFHEGHLMFNDVNTLVMVITVVPDSWVETILSGLTPLFERYSGVVFVSDVQVSRREYFGAREEQAAGSQAGPSGPV